MPISISQLSTKLEKPITSFGLITDIHYANHDDRWNYERTFLRRYRNSLQLVQQASLYWRNTTYPIAFIVQLGDLIDGYCKSKGSSNEDLTLILEQFKEIREICPIYHVWGNHEFYNFTRQQLLNGPLRSFDTSQIAPAHYGTWKISEHVRMIVLDTYELSLLGIENDNPTYQEAMDLLRKYNNNENINDPTGLEGIRQRFIRLNGGLKEKQLKWLKSQLENAQLSNEKVIILGHIPIHPNAADELALVWNYDEVLEVLWSFDDLILVYVAGHAHEGGHFIDEKRIHHLTMNAVVECDPDTNAFATVHVYDHYILIEGFGRIPTYRINFQL